eukprot:PhF_6_TR31542/c0_g1_i1/m.46535
MSSVSCMPLEEFTDALVQLDDRYRFQDETQAFDLPESEYARAVLDVCVSETVSSEVPTLIANIRKDPKKYASSVRKTNVKTFIMKEESHLRQLTKDAIDVLLYTMAVGYEQFSYEDVFRFLSFGDLVSPYGRRNAAVFEAVKRPHKLMPSTVSLLTNACVEIVGRDQERLGCDCLHFLSSREDISDHVHMILTVCSNWCKRDASATSVLVASLLKYPSAVHQQYFGVLESALKGSFDLTPAHARYVMHSFVNNQGLVHSLLSSRALEEVIFQCTQDTSYAQELCVLTSTSADMASKVALKSTLGSYIAKCTPEQGELILSSCLPYLKNLVPFVNQLLETEQPPQLLLKMFRKYSSLWAQDQIVSPKSPCGEILMFTFFGQSMPNFREAARESFMMRTIVAAFSARYSRSKALQYITLIEVLLVDYTESLFRMVDESGWPIFELHSQTLVSDILADFFQELERSLTVHLWDGLPHHTITQWIRDESSLLNVPEGPPLPTRAFRSKLWQDVTYQEMTRRAELTTIEHTLRTVFHHQELEQRGQKYAMCDALSFTLQFGAQDEKINEELACLLALREATKDTSLQLPLEILDEHVKALQDSDVVWLSQLARTTYTSLFINNDMQSADFLDEIDILKSMKPESNPDINRQYKALLTHDTAELSLMLRERRNTGSAETVAIDIACFAAFHGRTRIHIIELSEMETLYRSFVDQEESMSRNEMVMSCIKLFSEMNATATAREFSRFEKQLAQISHLHKTEKQLREEFQERLSGLKDVESKLTQLEYELEQKAQEISHVNSLLETCDKALEKVKCDNAYFQHVAEKATQELASFKSVHEDQAKRFALMRNQMDEETFIASKFKQEIRKLEKEVEAMSRIGARDIGYQKNLLKIGLFYMQDAEDDARTCLEKVWQEEFTTLVKPFSITKSSVGCGTFVTKCDVGSQSNVKDVAQADVFVGVSFLEELSRGKFLQAFKAYTSGMSQIPSEHEWLNTWFRRVPPARCTGAKLWRIVWQLHNPNNLSVKDYTTEVMCELSSTDVGFAVPMLLTIQEHKIVDICFPNNVEEYATRVRKGNLLRPLTAAAKAWENEDLKGEGSPEPQNNFALTFPDISKAQSTPNINSSVHSRHRVAVESAKMYS